jgi:hypothetical protein
VPRGSDGDGGEHEHRRLSHQSKAWRAIEDSHLKCGRKNGDGEQPAMGQATSSIRNRTDARQQREGRIGPINAAR